MIGTGRWYIGEDGALFRDSWPLCALGTTLPPLTIEDAQDLIAELQRWLTWQRRQKETK